MWKKVRNVVLCFAILLVACLVFNVPADAASSLSATYSSKYAVSSSRTLQYDMTHDGKADKIKVSVKTGSYGDVSSVKVSVNGKNALSLSSSQLGDAYGGVYVQYFRFSSSQEFLVVSTSGVNGHTGFARIYRYNTSKKKLVKVLDMKSMPVSDAEISSIGNNTITVTYNKQFVETGYLTWAYTYKYKGGKFQRTKTSAPVKSLGYGCEDAYRYSIMNGQLKISAASLKFYTKPGGSTKAFTVKKGKTVSMKNIYYKGGKFYIQCEYNGKSGYFQIGTRTYSQVYKSGATNSLFYGIRLVE